MLPPELLRLIFLHLIDVECLETLHYLPSSDRYKVEYSLGKRDDQTKWALLLASKALNTLAQEVAWSWIRIGTIERLYQIDRYLRLGISQDNQQGQRLMRVILPTWILRIDVHLKMVLTESSDDGPVIPVFKRILSVCPNLITFTSDTVVASIDCQRTSLLVQDAIMSLKRLRRLDFAGHEGPSLGDFMTLIPHLSNLEQLATGRIADPRLEEEEIVNVIHPKALDTRQTQVNSQAEVSDGGLSLPSLQTFIVSQRPIHSCLRLFNHIAMPSLVNLCSNTLDFMSPRLNIFMTMYGPQLLSIDTYDIRTQEEPYGYARVLSICPKLQHLSFSPRLHDERHNQSWVHHELQIICLNNILPESLPPEEELADNIGRSVGTFIERIMLSRSKGELPSLTTMRIEFATRSALEYGKRYGEKWNTSCASQGIVLQDRHGRPYPWDTDTSRETYGFMKPLVPTKPKKTTDVIKRFLQGIPGVDPKAWKR
jgi:hypothetical protein